jgi:hypothetical protein
MMNRVRVRLFPPIKRPIQLRFDGREDGKLDAGLAEPAASSQHRGAGAVRQGRLHAVESVY